MSGKFSSAPRVSDSDMNHGACVTHVSWCIPRTLTSGFLWSQWRGKRSRHSRRMHNPQFYLSGKRPTAARYRDCAELTVLAGRVCAFATGHHARVIGIVGIIRIHGIVGIIGVDGVVGVVGIIGIDGVVGIRVDGAAVRRYTGIEVTGTVVSIIHVFRGAPWDSIVVDGGTLGVGRSFVNEGQRTQLAGCSSHWK